MEVYGIVAIPVITLICYLIVEGFKLLNLDNKYNPVVAGVSGGILGVVALYVAPNITPATDILTAIAIGIVSGFAATGVHQMFKQLGGK